jgi:hypothetical protein
LTRTDLRTLDTETRTVRLTSKQITDVLTLTAEAGDEIRLNIDLVDGIPGTFAVIAELDDEELMRYNSRGLPENIVLGFVVPQDGSIRILVEDTSGVNSVLEISAQADNR